MKSNVLDIIVKITAAVIAFMIMLRFFYLFYDFILNPFHAPITLSEESIKHIMTGLILLELLILTFKFITEESIDPNLIIILSLIKRFRLFEQILLFLC